MAGSRRLPLLTIALALLLKSLGSANAQDSRDASSPHMESANISASPANFSPDASFSSPGDASTPQPSPPGTEEIATSQLSSTTAESGVPSGTPHPMTVSQSTSESPSSEPTPASDSTPSLSPWAPSSSTPAQDASSPHTESASISATPATFPPDASSSSPGDASTPQPSPPGTEEIATSQLSSTTAESGVPSGTPHPMTVSQSTSESPSSEPTLASDSTPSLPPWAPSSSTPAQGDTQTPMSHRNPAMVIVVCILVSLVLIGSVLLVVRHHHRGPSEFLPLDEVSMDRVSQQ